MYSFVNDRFMPPDDPLGRHGPSLDNFLRKKPVVTEHRKQQCPYGKKCTYGIKCKFHHPERPHQLQRSVADELRANARLSSPRGAKEERMSRGPSLGSIPMDDEKASAIPKTRPGEGPALFPRGAPTKKGHSYRSSEQYLLPPRDLSQDHLDSGIGSLDSQLSEMWPNPIQRAGGCRGQPPPYVPPPGPKSRHYAPYLPQDHFLPSSGPAQVAPHSFPGYSVVPDSPLGSRRAYWSEPYHPGLADSPRACHPPYGDASGHWASPKGFAEERAKVHVKLCGIFHPHLVEAVMGRFPHLLDPQKLAAEILTYKSQQ